MRHPKTTLPHRPPGPLAAVGLLGGFRDRQTERQMGYQQFERCFSRGWVGVGWGAGVNYRDNLLRETDLPTYPD